MEHREEMDSDHPLNPKTFYGISKMRGEEHIQRIGKKIPTFIARCGNVYGYSKSMRFDAVINRFMFDANYADKISVNGDGNQSRAFIHVNKLTSALVGLLKDDVEPQTFNLVDTNLSVNDIIETLSIIYPEMEMLFINQHMNLRSVKATPNKSINNLFADITNSLEQELRAFKEDFTF